MVMFENAVADVAEYDDLQARVLQRAGDLCWMLTALCSPRFSWQQLNEVLLGLEMNLAVEVYADVAFTAEQMRQLRYGLADGVDVSEFAVPDLPASLMRLKRLRLVREQYRDPAPRVSALPASPAGYLF